MDRADEKNIKNFKLHKFMKQRNPIDRYDLHIHRKDRVLEVGCGHNPSYRANVVVEKFIDSNYHRSDNMKIFLHQKFVEADGANMPFKNKEFDYIICNQVLEHADDPVSFVKELQRVASKGYIELPSLVGESLFPKVSHKWVCLEIDQKLVLYEKAKLPNMYPDYGKTFLNFLPYQSLALRTYYLSYHQAHTVRYEWSESIDIIVNPTDEYYKSFFEKSWTTTMASTIFPIRSKKQDIIISFKVMIHLMITMLKRRIFVHIPVSLDEYKSKKMNL